MSLRLTFLSNVALVFLISIANLSSDAANDHSPRSCAERQLKFQGIESSHETVDVLVMLVEDKNVMDLLCVRYLVDKFYLADDFMTASECIDRELNPHEVVDIIKSRNILYTKVTKEICEAAYYVFQGSSVFDQNDRSQTRKWVMYGPVLDPKYKADQGIWDEMIVIYNEMVKEADALKAARDAQAQSPAT